MKIVGDLVAQIAWSERFVQVWNGDHVILLANQLVIMRALLVLLTSKESE